MHDCPLFESSTQPLTEGPSLLVLFRKNWNGKSTKFVLAEQRCPPFENPVQPHVFASASNTIARRGSYSSYSANSPARRVRSKCQPSTSSGLKRSTSCGFTGCPKSIRTRHVALSAHAVAYVGAYPSTSASAPESASSPEPPWIASFPSPPKMMSS